MIDDVLVSSLLKAMVPALVDALVKVSTGKELNLKAPVYATKGGGMALREPSERLAIGIRRREGKLVQSIFLENDSGSAKAEADKLSLASDEQVLIETLGTAYSARAEQTSTTGPQLLPGLSVAHKDGYAGSVGAFVEFKYPRSSQKYKGFTSASHVVGWNDATKGSLVVTPGRPDKAPDVAHRIGTVGRYSLLSHYSEQNQVDAVVNLTDVGVAELDLELIDRVVNTVPVGPKAANIEQLCDPFNNDDLINHLEEPVFMYGRSSGFDEGVLHAVGIQPYSMRMANKIYLYGDVGLIRPKARVERPFSRPGDSGAPIYTSKGRLLGFLIGGVANYGLFQPAHSCLEAIDARLI